MIRVEIDSNIKRPIEGVFDRLVDIDRYPKWLSQSKVFLDCRQTSEGPVGLGTTFIDKTRIGTYQGEITNFERPTKVDFRMRLHRLGMKVMESRPVYGLQQVNGGTKVHLIAEGELYGLFKLTEPYVAIRAREERRRTVDALKRALESSLP